MPASRSNGGWTLIETALALGAAAILLAIGVGTTNAARHAINASTARGEMLASLVQARNAAVIRDSDVVLCPSQDAATCARTHHWEHGWIVFADLDDDRRRSAREPLIGSHAALPDGVRLLTSRGRRTLDFQPSGGNAGSNATFTLCDGRGPGRASAFAMSNRGGLRDVRPSASAVIEACGL